MPWQTSVQVLKEGQWPSLLEDICSDSHTSEALYKKSMAIFKLFSEEVCGCS